MSKKRKLPYVPAMPFEEVDRRMGGRAGRRLSERLVQRSGDGATTGLDEPTGETA